MSTLLAAGAAGATVGGPLWGLLGAAALLFGVGWICHLLQYDQDTAELERCYDSPVTVPLRLRLTTRAAVLWRTRSFVLIPLSEMESLSS